MPDELDRTREGWNAPRPGTVPRRTLWPAAAALGMVLTLWGVVTVYLVAAVGIALLSVSVLGWIEELRRGE